MSSLQRRIAELEAENKKMKKLYTSCVLIEDIVEE